jgi:N-methylhydantoinase B
VSPVDPVTFEVLWHKLMQLAEEMGITYFRTTGSHVVITGTDASSAIMTPEGEAVAVGPYIVTQANVLPLIVRSTIEHCSANPGIGPGDVFICNDPYSGAIHQPDIASVTPIYDGDELIAWLGTSGHQVDNGGMEPGGFSVGAVEIHQEGLRIPPVKIVEKGILREDILRWIDNQVRDPLVALDVRAQVATLTVGARRMEEIRERYGSEPLKSTMTGILDFAEERFVERLRSLPDGTWWQTQYVDHDGHEPNIYTIECAVTKRGDRLVVDFEGTSANARGIINATYAGLNAGVLSAVYILLAFDLPWNSGIRRRIEVRAAPGTINNAAYPAPVTMATISATIVTIDAVWSCLSQMLLESDLAIEAMANWSGSSLAPIFTGVTRGGEPFAHTEMSHFGGGGGARVFRDGVDSAGIVFNTTPNIPNIETNEQDFPVLYLFRRHLTDSGGPGRFRGGMSGELAYVPHKAGGHMDGLFAGTGSYMPNAIGLAGGLPGSAVRVLRVAGSEIPERLARGEPLPERLEAAGGALEVLGPKHPRTPLVQGDIWYHTWQSGAGYGDPIERDPEAVLRDVLDLAVSGEAAQEIYGVVVDDGRVDLPATVARRAELRRQRLGREPKPASPGDGQRVVADSLVVDDSGATSCRRCGEALGRAGVRRARDVAVVLESGLDPAGPHRGQDYGDQGFRLHRYVCPGCGLQFHAELAYRGDRLVPAPLAPSETVAYVLAPKRRLA